MLWGLLNSQELDLHLGFVFLQVLAASCVIFVLALIADIRRLKPARSCSLRVIILRYVVHRVLSVAGWFMFQKVQKYSKNLAQEQQVFLLHLLKKNQNTDFGKDHSFTQISSRDDYKKHVRLRTYDDYSPYLTRIFDGVNNVLSADRVTCFAVTSGTTGKAKLVPLTSSFYRDKMKLLSLLEYANDRQIPFRLAPVLFIMTKPLTTKHTCGLPQGTLSAYMISYPLWAAAPPEVFHMKNEEDAMYFQAVFGFSNSDISEVFLQNAPTCLNFWLFVSANWDAICADIESGSTSRQTDEFSNKLIKYLKPNHSRAEELKYIFKLGPVGLAARIWPNLQAVKMLTTGTFALASKILRETYLEGVLQLSSWYGSSEGIVGLNLDLNPASSKTASDCYTCVPWATFLEFIPEHYAHMHDTEDIPTLFTDEVRAGEKYEIVMTTTMGMYRYRLGDIVKVVDHVGQIPVLQFQYRQKQVLNVGGENMTEQNIETILQDAFVECRDEVLIRDFTATESFNLHRVPEMKDFRKRYVILLELHVQDKTRSFVFHTEKLSLKVDEAFRKSNSAYGLLREKDVGPVSLVQVQPGTFQDLKTQKSSWSHNAQFKVPRTTRDADVIAFLFSRQIHQTHDKL